MSWPGVKIVIAGIAGFSTCPSFTGSADTVPSNGDVKRRVIEGDVRLLKLQLRPMHLFLLDRDLSRRGSANHLVTFRLSRRKVGLRLVDRRREASRDRALRAVEQVIERGLSSVERCLC